MPSHEKETADHKGLETVAGGGAGALIGGIAGLAAGLGAMAIPGIGPAIAAGALAVAIGSAGIGAAAGGVVGALTASEAATPPDQPDHKDQPAEQTPVEHDAVTTTPSAGLVYLDGLELAPRRSRFEDFERDYRADFTARNLSGRTYEQISPAYRYGYSLASDSHFANEDWLAVEDYARREWESENPGSWDQVKEVVRYAWQSRRSTRGSE